MSQLTNFLVEGILLEEQGITVLLPGGFKPPHAGHLQLAEKYAERQDVKDVLVLVGPIERNGVTREESIKIWKVLARNPKIRIVATNFDNPMQAAYEYVLGLQKDSKAVVAMAASNKGEDAKRSDIFVQAINGKYKTQGTKDGRYTPKDVTAVKLGVDISPMLYTNRTDGNNGPISASTLRSDMQKKDIQNIKTSYPNLSDVEINKVLSVLTNIKLKENMDGSDKLKQFVIDIKAQGSDAKKAFLKLIRREKLTNEESQLLINILRGVGIAAIPGGSLIALGAYLAPRMKKAAKGMLSEGGAGGHMAHPFDFTNSGTELINVFKKAIESIKKGGSSVKIDGVNASIRLADINGKREFALDRGSASDLDVKGVTTSDLPARFPAKGGQEHGFVGIGGKVLKIFNDAIPTTKNELKRLGLLDNPNILLNIEYVSGQTNVIGYGDIGNFLAIHGLKEIKPKNVDPKTGKVKSREAHNITYDKAAMSDYIKKLNVVAQKNGFKVLGTVDVKFKNTPNLQRPLSEKVTLYPKGSAVTKSLGDWLKDVKFQTPLIIRKDYVKAAASKNIAQDFPNIDLNKVVGDTVVYTAIVKLGDEVLNNATSEIGDLEKHEGIVISDDSIYPGNPFKITGKFLTQGLESSFGVKENITEEKEIVATAPALNLRLHFDHSVENQSTDMPGVDLNMEITISSTGGKMFAKTLQSSEQAQAYSNKVKVEITQAFKEFNDKLQGLFTKYKL
jgi:hypothetical protein